MSTKYFIGGNKFYDLEEEANAELAALESEHGLPYGEFVVVKINKKDKPSSETQQVLH